MADQIRQELMQLVGRNPEFLEQTREQLSVLAADPDIQLEELPQIISELEATLRDPESYPALIDRFEREGFIDPGDLPTEFDQQVVVALLIAFYLLQDEMEAAQNAPAEFARGGLASVAERLRRAGRNGDTVLAHINPEEARLLESLGGSGTINPITGLPEYSKLKKAVKKALKVVAPIALNLIAPGLGTAIGTAIGLSGTAAAVAGSALIGGAVSKLGGGSFTQGALGGAIGGGLGGMVGSAANNALNLGLGQAGQTVLGNALAGAAQGELSGAGALQGALGAGLGAYGANVGGTLGSAISGLGGAVAGGGDPLRGGLAGLINSYQIDSPFGSAVKGAANSAIMGGDVAQGAIRGGISDLAGKYKENFKGLATSGLKTLAGGFMPSLVGKNQNEQDGMATDPLNTGITNPFAAEDTSMISAAPGNAYGGGSTARGPFEPMKGTFRVAPNDQVALWARGMGGTGSMESSGTRLPVNPVYGDNNYVQRFINAAESGGYLNPNWATYRPGVQLMASGNPSQLPGEAGAQAYVPNFRTPGTADTVMLVNTGQYSPQAAAQVLAHELYHTKQPSTERDVYAGSPGNLQKYQQNLSNVLPYLQEKYGYRGAYDTQTNKVPLNERMADMQSFQFNQGIDFASDPVFQQKVFGNDPYARAAWNASTIERTTRLDPRDLPPGQVTSSDFGPGGAPLTFRAQEWLKKRGFAKGGLAMYKERLNG